MRAGSWGATLAGVLSRNGHTVTLVAPNAKLREELLRHRENRAALPGVTIPEEVRIVAEPGGAADAAELVLFPGPCDRMREMARSVAGSVTSNHLVVTAAKGIEIDTLLRMSQVLADELPPVDADAVVALSGPSFARFVGLGQPTTVVAASADDSAARAAQDAFMSRSFRVYHAGDIVGVELGGALKNVIALAAGMVEGLGFGDNTRAALITRGLAEISRLGTAMGAEPRTFAGLSGMGDLVLTCSSGHSRNYTVGRRIGAGETLDDVLSDMVTVAEGVKTTRAALELARRHGVDVPIAGQVSRVLFDGVEPRKGVAALMTREPKAEHWT